MAKSIPAIVTPEVLQWARSLDKITVDEIAQKLKVDVAQIEAWESGNESPMLPQAKNLAKQYRVPFAYFYLPNTPQKTKRLDGVYEKQNDMKGQKLASKVRVWYIQIN